MDFDSLFDDILIEIFNFLSLKEKCECEAVCKRWRNIILKFNRPRVIRFELMIYKRSSYRIICSKPEHQFTNLTTIKFNNVDDINKVDQVLSKYCDSLSAICFVFTLFNHFQYLICKSNCLNTIIKSCNNLEHVQVKAYGYGLNSKFIEKLKPLICKLKHFAIDYKEEDITKMSSQPWIRLLLSYGSKLEAIYIKFQRMGIEFPLDLKLPINMKLLYLPSCDFSEDQLIRLIENGGHNLIELSLHSISSSCIKIIYENMKQLKKLNVKIKINDQKKEVLKYLALLNNMESITLNKYIPPDSSSLMYDVDVLNFTVLEVIANCPATTKLRLNRLSLLNKRLGVTQFKEKEEALKLLQVNKFAYFDSSYSKFKSLHINDNSFEYFMIKEKKNRNKVEHLFIKLDDNPNEIYLDYDISVLISGLTEFQNLKYLHIENFPATFKNSMLIIDLIINCKNLFYLQLNYGEMITPEIIDAFVEKALDNPLKKFELKFKNKINLNLVLPHNLILF